jgi:hypothetical protein
MSAIDLDDPRKAARIWLEEIAGYRQPAESVKGMLRRIAMAAGLSPARQSNFGTAKLAESTGRRARFNKAARLGPVPMDAAKVLRKLDRAKRLPFSHGKNQPEPRSTPHAARCP